MFKDYHPLVNLIYFVFVIGVTMLSNDPWFTALTLVFAWVYSYMLKGKKALKQNLAFTIPILIIMTLVNAIFVHNGATILFYISDLRITLEAFTYGVVSAMMLSAVLIWFSCFSEIMTSDKLIYVFGKARPVMGLTLSMIFRFIPLLRERFREIQMGQKAMGRADEQGFMGKARQFIKEVSILISWSLESSIETADSMEARGYGLKGRTSFHLFRFDTRDTIMTVISTVPGIICLAAAVMGKTDIYYYPMITFGEMGLFKLAALVSYIILLAIPVFTDIKGIKKWQLSR